MLLSWLNTPTQPLQWEHAHHGAPLLPMLLSWLGAPTLNDGKGEVNGEILTMQCVLITLWTHRESSWRMARAYAAAAATLLSSAQLRICSSDNFEFEASFLRVDFLK